MPEKPEVQSFADSLNKLLAGEELLELKLDKKSRYRKAGKSLANLPTLNNSLPLTIKRVWSKGKKIIFDLGRIFLVSSLGLEGKWIPKPQNHSNLWLVYEVESGDTTKEKKIYFDDVRHHGTLEIIVGKRELETRLAKIGPDLLNDDVTVKQWLKVYRQKVLANKEICKVMMEQKYFSGIGNYIKAMALYKAGIRPDALIEELEDKDLAVLYKYVKRIIRDAYEARGASIRSYKDFNGDKGDFKVEVYGKKHDKKGREVIVTVHSDGRSTHWVPSYQVIPSPWEGPPKLSKTKLKKSSGRGADTYNANELKGFCKQYKVSQIGTKEEMVKRLIKVV